MRATASTGDQAQPPGRLVAERFRRIWQLVEEIASHPGQTRKRLAAFSEISERQLQSDLGLIRDDMRLPLVRRRGYRFVTRDEETSAPFSLAEAQLLLMVLRGASGDPTLPTERLHSLLEKLPLLFPLHLRPLLARTLETVTAEPFTRHQQVFSALTEALLRKSYVKLHLTPGDEAGTTREPVVKPEVLFPYLDSWFLIGVSRPRGRLIVFDVDSVVAVTHTTGL